MNERTIGCGKTIVDDKAKFIDSCGSVDFGDKLLLCERCTGKQEAAREILNYFEELYGDDDWHDLKWIKEKFRLGGAK